MLGCLETAVLDNGIRLVTYKRQSTKAVAFYIFYGCGTRYEDSNIVGVSHALEHMIYKGTPTRTSIDISRETEGVGASINAMTGEEFTRYYFKAPSRVFLPVFEVYTDLLKNSLLAEEAWSIEQQSILEELNWFKDTPDIWVKDQLVMNMYNLQMGVIGNKETISAIQPSDMRELMSKWYHPNNMIVSVAGDLDFNLVKDLVEQHYGNLQPSELSSVSKTPSKSQKILDVLVRPNVNQVSLAFGIRAYSLKDEKRPVLAILNDVLGGKMSSRLFYEVREKRGLAYSISSSINDIKCSDAGVLTIWAGIRSGKAEEATKIIIDECLKLAQCKLSEGELNEAKQHLIGIIESIENSDYFAISHGESWLLKGRIETYEEKIREIEKVTAEEVQEVAKDIFSKEINAVYIASEDLTDKIEPILRHK